MTRQPSFLNTQSSTEQPSVPDASLYLTLADAIAAEITNGSIPNAVAMTESMLAQMFNVSRTPARQALLNLVEKDIITALPTRGYVTGQDATAPTSRLIDYPSSVEALTRTLKSVTHPSPLYEDLERQVVQLSVHGAWRISVRAAQDYYTVSRGALEDTLRELEINGLANRRPGGQWIVVKMDTARLEAIFDVRSWLEPKLLEQATLHIPVDVLQTAIDDHTSALQRLPDVSGGELDALETVLHHDMLEYAGNVAGLAALRPVKAGLIFSKHTLASDEIPVGTEDPFIEEHLAVLGALKRRSSEESKLRLLAHLLESRGKCASRMQRYSEIARGTKCDFAKRIDE